MLEYSIRESRRARRVLLKADPERGLEVVIPTGYDRRQIPRLLLQHTDWLREVGGVIETARRSRELPPSVTLAASGESLPVLYRKTGSSAVRVRETAAGLQLTGDVENQEACRRALRRWLCRRARNELLYQLQELALRGNFDFRGCSVRLQRSRWGSCSPRGHISLNACLLFLPPHLVRYVLIHELCHTRRLDHSRKFWALVARHEPGYKARRRELASMREQVPWWVHGQS